MKMGIYKDTLTGNSIKAKSIQLKIHTLPSLIVEGSVNEFSNFFLRLQFITTPPLHPNCEDFEKV